MRSFIKEKYRNSVILPKIGKNITQKIVDEIKGLIIDITYKAKSGHPGGAFSSTDFLTILFSEHLSISSDYPNWLNRDRFVLSAGHESALLYSLLFYSGYLELEDLKQFRQLNSRTPGHPEVNVTPGVEASTGPLGQGFANAVGMAIAQKHLEAKFGNKLFNHKVYVLSSDGDMQTPIVSGAAALAGHYKLNNLFCFYDKNNIQITGPLHKSDSTDYKMLFESHGWEVKVIDGHDHKEIREQLLYFKRDREKPLLIIGNTTIAKGSHSLEGYEISHGSPFSKDEICATKEKLGLLKNKEFQTSNDVLDLFNTRKKIINNRIFDWEQIKQKAFLLNETKKNSFDYFYNFKIEPDSTKLNFDQDKPMSTRKAMGILLEKYTTLLPNLFGGSADLEPSVKTNRFAKMVGDFTYNNYVGRNIQFGVREFPMAAIINGLALYGGFKPFAATYMVFSDYARSAIRMAALQKLPSIFIFSHDSIFVGEDGPTHQPIEHIMSLRLIPNLLVFRPADAIETESCMKIIMSEKNRPSALCLSRQTVPILKRENRETVSFINRGAYLIHETKLNHPTSALIFATGSEVGLAIELSQKISAHMNKNVKVISIPCWELFFEQDMTYQNEVLDDNIEIRISLEAATSLGWTKFIGQNGLSVSVDSFGTSANLSDIKESFNFNIDAIYTKVINHFKL